jgi:hypothetical protein
MGRPETCEITPEFVGLFLPRPARDVLSDGSEILMDSVTLLVMLVLSSVLAVFSARQVLGSVLYFMARNAAPAQHPSQHTNTPAQS